MKLNNFFPEVILLLIHTLFLWSCDVQKAHISKNNIENISICFGTTKPITLFNLNPVKLIVDTSPNCTQTPAFSSAEKQDSELNFSALNAMHWNSSNPLCASINPTQGSSTILTPQNNTNQECRTIVTANFKNQTTTFDFTINLNPVPPVSTFTISGSVSGLSGTGLVLQNNSGDNLSISANGAFTFSTPIASGGSYAVTVFTQPSTPTQTCTVTNGSGTVTNANITNVSVTCATLILNSATNVTVTGQTAVLDNNATSQTNGFTLTFANVGSLTCSDVSITTTAAYGFVPNGASFLPSPVTSTMPQYSCALSGSQITLSSAPPLSEGFHPWVDNFDINMGATAFVMTVNTQFSPSQTLSRGDAMNLGSFTGCGLRGTVLQRVFDCSKKISNYGATVTATESTSTATGSTSGTYYTAYNGTSPDLYWFVVSCPSSNGSVSQLSCHWLTPVVPAGNPALDSTGGGLFPTFTLALLTGYQKRLLLSGKMTRNGSGYNFADANGFPSTSAQVYSASGSPGVNPGVIPTTAQPTPSPASVCNAASGGSLISGTFPPSDASVRDLVSLTTGATIGWQMPSYAMVNILTGGTPTAISAGTPTSSCPASGTGTTFNGRPFCDMPLPSNTNNQGFSAINVPGFSQTNTFSFNELLWSSSSYDGVNVWLFVTIDGSNLLGGNLFGLGPTTVASVRCASLAWY